MKSRETLIRLKKFQVDEKRRRVAQIEGMIADFQRMSVDLEREIQSEQERAGINDPTHFAYPTYAKAAIQRRENLTRSADELRIQLEDAKSLLGEAFEELKKVELLDERDQARERAEENAREQADTVEIGLFPGVFFRALARLIALVQQLDFLELLEGFTQQALGVFKLNTQFVGGAGQIFPPLDRRLGIGRIGEVRG